MTMTDMTDTYIVKRDEIDAMAGLHKQHFLNPNAERTNRSLGDLTGLTGIGFHIIEVPPGKQTTEFHVHYHEDECVYLLSGTAEARIGDETFHVVAGDFIGYRKGGKPHCLTNTGSATLRCIVVGQRLEHDVTDYPEQKKRLYRQPGHPWDLVDAAAITHPVAGQKA